MFSVAELEVDAGALETKTKRHTWNAFWLEEKEVPVIIFKIKILPYKAFFYIFTATLDQVSQVNQNVWGEAGDTAGNVNDKTVTIYLLRPTFATEWC